MSLPRAVLVAALVVVAGCVGFGGGPGTTAGHPDDEEYAHEVRVENDLPEAREVTVTVVRGGEAVHEATHRVPANDSVVVYGWAAETVSGNGTAVVWMRPAGGDAERVTVEVTDCLGNVVGYFTEDGFGLTYSIC